jgi:hypothetical protein
MVTIGLVPPPSAPEPTYVGDGRALPAEIRLWRDDAAGLHALALARAAAGELDPAECATLRQALRRAEARLDRWNDDEWSAAIEPDAHAVVERLLREEAGSLGERLCGAIDWLTATARRRYACRAADRLDSALRDLEQVLLGAAVSDTPPAARRLLACGWPIADDRERLAQARRRACVLPREWGSEPVSDRVDIVLLRELLGLRETTNEAPDWVTDYLFTSAALAAHLSRAAAQQAILPPAEAEQAHRLAGWLAGAVAARLATPGPAAPDDAAESLFTALDTLTALVPCVTLQLRAGEDGASAAAPNAPGSACGAAAGTGGRGGNPVWLYREPRP